ncbi:MAG TPA: hypothetical protein VN554_02810 [Verrucomicrobiae bacterium]|nr:hypothetical protein [Verrucomicrobiae bacterium]
MEEKKADRVLWAEIAGWYGTAAIVLAYVLVSFNILPAGGGAYQVLNLTGALGIVAIAAVRKIRQPLLLNLFWVAIALGALIKMLIR